MTVLKQLRSIWLTSGAVIALATGLVPVAAAAQASPDRIDVIEQHIRRLEGELQALKRELGATRQQLRQSWRETEQARAQAQQTARSAGQPQPPPSPHRGPCRRQPLP